jgi:hypothetical protein
MSIPMERTEAIFFANQLREAREAALHDSEEFDGIIHTVERLGICLSGAIKDFGRYKPNIETQLIKSALTSEIPNAWPLFHTPFSRLYDLVRIARNDAVHQGAYARRLTEHAIQLSLVLEDALRRSEEMSTVGDFMVRNPICAELWHPMSFIRQAMLANSFSFLPIKIGASWHLVSDLQIAKYLGMETAGKSRNHLLATTLEASQIDLKEARYCYTDMTLSKALDKFAGDPSPLLVEFSKSDHSSIIGILTPFDLL